MPSAITYNLLLAIAPDARYPEDEFLVDVVASGPGNRVAAGAGPCEVAEIHFSIGRFAPSFVEQVVSRDPSVIAENDHRLFLRMPQLPKDEQQRILDELAETGLLERVFGEVPAGSHVAPIVDADAAAEAAAWLERRTTRTALAIGTRVAVPADAVPADWTREGEVVEAGEEAVVVLLDNGRRQELPHGEITPL